MEVALIIFLAVGCFAGGWIGSDYVDTLRKPTVVREEIRTETKVDTTVKSEMKNYQVQSTTVYNDSDAALILSFTNQTAYSNLLEHIETNSSSTKTTTNTTTN